MKRSDHLPRLLVGLLLVFGAAAAAQAQTTLDIDGASRVSNGAGGWTYNTWKPMLGMPAGAQTSGNGYMVDPLDDQQTGQYDSDFVSSVSGTSANSGFLVNFGTINGVGGTPYTDFLPLMNAYGQPVPEPSAYGLLLGADLGGLFLCRSPGRPAPLRSVL